MERRDRTFMSKLNLKSLLIFFVVTVSALFAEAAPKVVLISLDGATPRLVQEFQQKGALSKTEGLGFLENKGLKAFLNVTITPSLTAPGHIAIATGSETPATDVSSNTFHLVASPLGSSISGFGAPVGGYSIDGPDIATIPTAELLWNPLRQQGKIVVAATWPAADGIDVRVPGLVNSPIIQSSNVR